MCESALNGKPAVIKDSQEYQQIDEYLQKESDRFIRYWVADSTQAGYVRRRPEMYDGGKTYRKYNRNTEMTI